MPRRDEDDANLPKGWTTTKDAEQSGHRTGPRNGLAEAGSPYSERRPFTGRLLPPTRKSFRGGSRADRTVAQLGNEIGDAGASGFRGDDDFERKPWPQSWGIIVVHGAWPVSCWPAVVSSSSVQASISLRPRRKLPGLHACICTRSSFALSTRRGERDVEVRSRRCHRAVDVSDAVAVARPAARGERRCPPCTPVPSSRANQLLADHVVGRERATSRPWK